MGGPWGGSRGDSVRTPRTRLSAAAGQVLASGLSAPAFSERGRSAPQCCSTYRDVTAYNAIVANRTDAWIMLIEPLLCSSRL